MFVLAQYNKLTLPCLALVACDGHFDLCFAVIALVIRNEIGLIDYRVNIGDFRSWILLSSQNWQWKSKNEQDGGDQKYFVYFNKPADVRKMVYMVHKNAELQKDDDRWLYMPALDLIKRIAAGDKRTSFVGSDFLYEDVSGRSLQEDTHELIDANKDFFIVKNVPKKPDTVEFSYYNVAIDRKNFVPMKMEFYDKQGKLHRVIESKTVEVIQDFPTVVKSLVSDLKTGSKTEMEFSDVKYDIGLDDKIFTERYLRRPPREAMRWFGLKQQLPS